MFDKEGAEKAGYTFEEARDEYGFIKITCTGPSGVKWIGISSSFEHACTLAYIGVKNSNRTWKFSGNERK